MTWLLTLWPPLAFGLVLAAASGIAVRRGAASSEAVGAFVEARVSTLLAVTLAVVGATLGLLLLDAPMRGQLAGVLTASPAGVALGAAVGASIAGVYFGGIDRLVAGAQARFGDYVPSGSTAALGSGGAAFVLANGVLAPLVEEVWYRGLLFDALTASFGPLAAVGIGCAAFGLFHWPGGAWYMLATGVLVGGACWGLRLYDGGLAAPYAAHLTLNVIEIAVLRRRASKTGVEA